MKFKYFKSDGAESGEKDVDNFPTLEDGKGIDALRQCVIAVHANQRQGNASTKVRSEVSGSGKKIYRQKGLGVGRAGDKKAIQRRGGGVIFGPRPRSYNQKLNKKIKLLALKRALIDQATSENILYGFFGLGLPMIHGGIPHPTFVRKYGASNSYEHQPPKTSCDRCFQIKGFGKNC